MRKYPKEIRGKAISLRKDGLSYLEISKKLQIPKTTLSSWFKDKKWSVSIKEKLTKKARKNAVSKLRAMSKANKARFENAREGYRTEAKRLFEELTQSQLFLAGLMIYWGEGDSKIENCLVRISNTDWRMVKVFTEFLIKICAVPEEKIKAMLILYPDLDEQICKNFWAKQIGIAPKMFYKTQCIRGKHPTARLKNGICCVNVNSRELKEKILIWIGLYYKKFIEAGVA